jgi:hypothetical protein
MAVDDHGLEVLRKSGVPVDGVDNSNLAIQTKLINSMVNVAYDAVTVTYPDTVTEVFTFRSGGIAGAVEAIITLIYTDATKADLESVERS